MAAKCARIWCVRPVVEHGLDQRAAVQARDHAPVGPRVAALACARGHARAAARIARNGQRDRAGIARHFSMHQRQINFSDIARTELLGEMFVRLVVPRHNHGARGFPVQPMHDARDATRRPLPESFPRRCRSAFTSVPRAMARARMDHHPGGLVHNHEIVVHQQQLERQIFGSRFQREAAAEPSFRWLRRRRFDGKPWRFARRRARGLRGSIPESACGLAPGHARREINPAAAPRLPTRR